MAIAAICSMVPGRVYAAGDDKEEKPVAADDQSGERLEPSLRIVGTAIRPAPGLNATGNTMLIIGGASLGGGILSFYLMKSVFLERRDSDYGKWQADPTSVDESKIRDEDESAHSAWIAGWALAGGGAGLLLLGIACKLAAAKQRERARAGIELDEHPAAGAARMPLRPSFTAGAFSDGRLTALSLQMDW